MDIHHLVKMANDIGNFFASDPDPAKAEDGFATHLRSFWDPRMRRELFSYLDSSNGAGLSDLALRGLRSHRDRLDPSRYKAN